MEMIVVKELSSQWWDYKHCWCLSCCSSALQSKESLRAGKQSSKKSRRHSRPASNKSPSSQSNQWRCRLTLLLRRNPLDYRKRHKRSERDATNASTSRRTRTALRQQLRDLLLLLIQRLLNMPSLMCLNQFLEQTRSRDRENEFLWYLSQLRSSMKTTSVWIKLPTKS